MVTRWVGLAALLLGCATAPDAAPVKDPPPQEALTHEESLRRVLSATADQETKVLRYSPVKCACPAFEVRIGLRWLRVELDGLDDPASLASRLLTVARNDDEGGHPREYLTRGDLATSLKRCGPGTLFADYGLEYYE